MKIDKKKITFIAVIGAVIIFIIAYSLLVFGKDGSQKDELRQTQLPVLENPVDDYTSRLDAVDDLKEVRETNAPSIYDERYLDSTGVFDPDFLDRKKQRIVDSIYNNGRIDYSTGTFRINNHSPVRDSVVEAAANKKAIKEILEPSDAPNVQVKEMALEQQLFFASDPLPNEIEESAPTLKVIVDDKKVLKVNVDEPGKLNHLRRIKLSIANEVLGSNPSMG